MAEIERYIRDNLTRDLIESKKAIILYGPRQVGKTTLVKKILAEWPHRWLEINADEERFVEVLGSRDARQLRELTSGYELLFVDEAQRVPEIGLNLKILIDQQPNLRIIATGSSSLELASGVSEPLTGRKWTYQLYPIAQLELQQHHNRFELNDRLEERLIWGSYPEIFSLEGAERKARYLRELSSDYLYKDILRLVDIRNPDKIRRLLKLLAFQMGNEVSLNELGQSLDMSKDTVARYIDLLEKSFVLFRLSAFSKNLRKEVAKNSKYYFYDLGIRNAVIDNFNVLSNRNDVGAMWECFLISERVKRNAYLQRPCKGYFWRIYSGAEIDYVEEDQGRLLGFEFKFGSSRPRKPNTFLMAYEGSNWTLVNRDNWLDFVLGARDVDPGK